MVRKRMISFAAAITVIAGSIFLISSVEVQGLGYGEGQYGECAYQDGCSISLSSSGTVSLLVTPGGSTTCTVANDVVSVTTPSSTGYTLQLSSSDTTNALEGVATAGELAAIGGTLASPASLAVNTWGYRVDGSGGFGVGPTTGSTDGGVPALAFAGVPVLASPDTIVTTSAPASPSNTDVWYGVCANTGTTADAYSDGVIYTAVVN